MLAIRVALFLSRAGARARRALSSERGASTPDWVIVVTHLAVIAVIGLIADKIGLLSHAYGFAIAVVTALVYTGAAAGWGLPAPERTPTPESPAWGKRLDAWTKRIEAWTKAKRIEAEASGAPRSRAQRRRAARARWRDERGAAVDEGALRIAMILMLAVIVFLAIKNGIR